MLWQQSIWVFAAFAVVAVACVLSGRPRVATVGSWLWQCAFAVGLYTVWQIFLDFIVTSTGGAVRRGRDIAQLEAALHLPSEAWLQRLVVHHHLLTEAANGWYAGLDYAGMMGCLFWLWWRHRERYWSLRLTLVVMTGAASVVQAIPVAPPRFVPGLGVVDTGALLHQSVYRAGGLSDPAQLTSMPSMHVAWAAFVAVAAVTASRSRWRWVMVAYPVLTTLVVVATGNHYWLDGVVGVGFLAAALAVQSAVRSRVGERASPARPEAPRAVVPQMATRGW